MWRFFLGLPLDLLPPLRRAVRWFALPDLVAEPPATGLMVARMLAGGAAAATIAVWALGGAPGERFLAFMLGQCGAVLGLGSVLVQSIAQEKRHG